MESRNVKASDYREVIDVLNQWWGGRNMADMLPKLFFNHFQNTSYIIEQDNKIIAFLIGFVSQTYPDEAYIHFVGVHPEYRKTGVAKKLYQLFFDNVQQLGCNTIRCVTSPINKTSIAFHTKLGFKVEKGNGEVEGIHVHTNYDGEGQDRVLFVKQLN